MKATDKLGDIPKEKLKLSEITSKYGFDIYLRAKKKFSKENDEDYNKIMNSLESAIIYFIANEVSDEYINEVCDSICNSLKENAKRIKQHKDMERKEKDMNGKDFLFSKELRERMEKFGSMGVSEAITRPDFYEALLDHAGMNQKEKNDLWEKVGRPDLKK